MVQTVNQPVGTITNELYTFSLFAEKIEISRKLFFLMQILCDLARGFSENRFQPHFARTPHTVGILKGK